MNAPAAVRAGALRAEVVRKALHLATALIPVAWGLGFVSSRVVQLTLGIAALVAVAVEVARRAMPAVEARFVQTVGALLRPHEAHAISGATWLAIAMALAAWCAPMRAAIVALWAAAVGDALAALVGRSVAHLRAASSGAKTLAGALACAASVALGAAWLGDASWSVALVLGAIAAAAEWPSQPLDDNLRVAGVVALAATVLGLR